MRKRKHSDLLTVTEEDKDASVANDRMEAIEGIRRGLGCMKVKRGTPAEKFFADFYDRNDFRDTN